ncbi:hypothetical protein AB1L42_14085 [Thalassoglobus sp. JC818]|uniref:hypothetical protein n=1 Tax=Thalassoglobus sp. JC818 TaxID=3232136 RepID=UPI0034583418
MPEYSYQRWKVHVAPDGSIKVQRGDTISGFCAAIYQKSPGSTQKHWGEFGRKMTSGKDKGMIVSLADPNKISAGEILFHIPSSSAISPNPSNNSQAVADVLLVKLKRLHKLRDEGIAMFAGIDKELAAQKKKIDNSSMQLDMIGVLVTGFALFGKAAAEVGKAAGTAQNAKKLLDPIFGLGVSPVDQGLVQGIAQNAIGGSGLLEPKVDDSTIVGAGKIATQWFFNLTSPSFYSKQLAGGDPNDTLRELAEQNNDRRREFLSRVDIQIARTKKELSLVNQK